MYLDELSEEEINELIENWEMQQQHLYEEHLTDMARCYQEKAAEISEKTKNTTDENHNSQIIKMMECWEKLNHQLEGLMNYTMSYDKYSTLFDVHFSLTNSIYSSIYLVRSGHYKSANILLRQYLETYLIALYYDYNKKLHDSRSKWLLGDKGPLPFSWKQKSIITELCNTDVKINASIMIKGIKLSHDFNDKSIVSDIRKIYQDLSKVVHTGMLPSDEKRGDGPILPLSYSEKHFEAFYFNFLSVIEITSLLLILKDPNLLEMDKTEWTNIFQFNQQTFRDNIDKANRNKDGTLNELIDIFKRGTKQDELAK